MTKVPPNIATGLDSYHRSIVTAPDERVPGSRWFRRESFQEKMAMRFLGESSMEQMGLRRVFQGMEGRTLKGTTEKGRMLGGRVLGERVLGGRDPSAAQSA
jgi:hypothetical protein